MQPAPVPPNESARLRALRDLELLDTAPEEAFDRVTRAAQRIFDVPMALVSLVDADRQWFKSRVGLGATETPRDISFCGHAILGDAPFVVSDATQDERFHDNPLVIGAPDIRFYAGMPLRSGGGERIGTLCIIDRRPRHLDEREQAILRDLGAWGEAELRARQQRRFLTDMPDAVIGLAADLRIEYVNTAAVRLLAQPAENLRGRHLRELLAPAIRALSQEALLTRLVSAGGTREPVDVEVHAHDGRTFEGELLLSEWRWLGESSYLAQLRDVSRKRAAERELARVSRELRAVLDSATQVAILATDLDGTITHFNRGAELMLGWRADEVVGRHKPDLFHLTSEVAVRADELSRALGRPLEHGEVFVHRAMSAPAEEQRWTYVRKDGVHVPVSVMTTLRRDEEGRVAGYLGVAVDIADRLAVERLKSEFVSVVSHELRTPLTSIRGSLGLLASGRMGEQTPQAARMLEIAINNTDRLVRLINDILDIERIESSVVEMNFGVHSCCSLVQTAVDGVRGQAEGLGVRLDSACDGETSVWVDGDRIVQTLTNLLGNALKFSSRGHCVTVRSTARPGEVRFEVVDRGRGIPAEKQRQIFDRFQQVDASDAREKGGTGLGLAICRSIVKQHGGDIGVDSEPGEGSTFWFTVPRQILPQTAEAPASGRRVRILLADPEAEMCEHAARLLRQHGFEVRSVDFASGESLVEVARGWRPHACLLDLTAVSEERGELLRQLREAPETRDIPILLMSELEPATSDEAEWVQKPLDQERLFRGLKRALGREPMRVLVVEDDVDLAFVLIAIFERYGILADHAGTGVEALQRCGEAAPDLIVLDLGLPDSDGSAVVEWLSRQEGLGRIPLVVYTARDVSERERARLTLGPTMVLTKGRVDPASFERHVVSMLTGILAGLAPPDDGAARLSRPEDV